ncbi:type II toxin-antitoxin system PemK/MazF family toxin [Pediococcus stilesii]|uniref:Type II toxin-antitoxin system PemK/MazF family toxin n=1 Tax=Pediococcus stilesii TaxID=331679 RepID=A0A0R2L328_9LACO|nr:type II toxin-antitoxin system PemK/MazF family toxin [Pediococcus stilesii]KRN93127.1 hypothetical protein IV81_GL000951 [Pediococcus stilesii]
MVEKPTTGSIIYIDFDPAIGAEIEKRRPAVVISNELLMETTRFIWVVPISHGTYDGPHYPLHVALDGRTKIAGTAYAEQIKSFDYTKRSWKFVEQMPQDLFEQIRKKAKLVL